MSSLGPLIYLLTPDFRLLSGGWGRRRWRRRRRRRRQGRRRWRQRPRHWPRRQERRSFSRSWGWHWQFFGPFGSWKCLRCHLCRCRHRCRCPSPPAPSLSRSGPRPLPLPRCQGSGRCGTHRWRGSPGRHRRRRRRPACFSALQHRAAPLRPHRWAQLHSATRWKSCRRWQRAWRKCRRRRRRRRRSCCCCRYRCCCRFCCRCRRCHHRWGRSVVLLPASQSPACSSCGRRSCTGRVLLIS